MICRKMQMQMQMQVGWCRRMGMGHAAALWRHDDCLA